LPDESQLARSLPYLAPDDSFFDPFPEPHTNSQWLPLDIDPHSLFSSGEQDAFTIDASISLPADTVPIDSTLAWPMINTPPSNVPYWMDPMISHTNTPNSMSGLSAMPVHPAHIFITSNGTQQPIPPRLSWAPNSDLESYHLPRSRIDNWIGQPFLQDTTNESGSSRTSPVAAGISPSDESYLSENLGPILPHNPQTLPQNSKHLLSSRENRQHPRTTIAKDTRRQRNNVAANKYRQKRIDRITSLEESLCKAEKERDAFRLQLEWWKSRATFLQDLAPGLGEQSSKPSDLDPAAKVST